ncbi:methyltransferase domain-containing protein [Ditylenchus destructor]|uniref:Methyltransferase domain-containing protein n=1 Tax=Ditylenchus destructor TaxID=166010 RepID=A0AAD4MES4_9BILA|nr:methyltransferase domain-containing protein [Ditylenchus destructor]
MRFNSGFQRSVCGFAAFALLVYLINALNNTSTDGKRNVHIRHIKSTDANDVENSEVTGSEDVLELLHGSIIDKYKSQLSERRRELQSITETSNFLALYPVLAPEVICGSLARFGRVIDGGKWVCNAHRIPQKECAIYSLGINNEPSFDVDLQNFSNKRCKLRAVDRGAATESTLKDLESIQGTYLEATIGNPTKEDPNKMSLEALMSKYGDKTIEILKVDIEGMVKIKDETEYIMKRIQPVYTFLKRSSM